MTSGIPLGWCKSFQGPDIVACGQLCQTTDLSGRDSGQIDLTDPSRSGGSDSVRWRRGDCHGAGRRRVFFESIEQGRCCPQAPGVRCRESPVRSGVSASGNVIEELLLGACGHRSHQPLQRRRRGQDYLPRVQRLLGAAQEIVGDQPVRRSDQQPAFQFLLRRWRSKERKPRVFANASFMVEVRCLPVGGARNRTGGSPSWRPRWLRMRTGIVAVSLTKRPGCAQGTKFDAKSSGGRLLHDRGAPPACPPATGSNRGPIPPRWDLWATA